MKSPAAKYTNSHLWDDLNPSNAALVCVHWKDIKSIDNWDGDNVEIAPVRRLTTVGYLLYDGPDPKAPAQRILVIASSYEYDEERFSEYTCFPREIVKKVERIR